MEKGTYYVYILRCRDGSLYTGLTNDLPRRWALHVSGRGAKYTRAHNDANVLCMGDRVVGAGLALELVQVFLTTPFEGGRHQTRIDQIMDIEAGKKLY